MTLLEKATRMYREYVSRNQGNNIEAFHQIILSCGLPTFYSLVSDQEYIFSFYDGEDEDQLEDEEDPWEFTCVDSSHFISITTKTELNDELKYEEVLHSVEWNLDSDEILGDLDEVCDKNTIWDFIQEAEWLGNFGHTFSSETWKNRQRTKFKKRVLSVRKFVVNAKPDSEFLN